MVADIRLYISAADALFLQRIHGRLVFLLRAGGHHHDIVAVQAQLPGDCKPDAPAGACHDRCLFHLFFSFSPARAAHGFTITLMLLLPRSSAVFNACCSCSSGKVCVTNFSKGRSRAAAMAMGKSQQ